MDSMFLSKETRVIDTEEEIVNDLNALRKLGPGAMVRFELGPDFA